MATTSPDNIWTPDAGDAYALTTDLAALADTVQDALSIRKRVYSGNGAPSLTGISNFDEYRDTATGNQWLYIFGVWRLWSSSNVSLSLNGGWSNVAGTGTASVRVTSGLVTLAGRLASGTGSTINALTLPAGFRPGENRVHAVSVGGTTGVQAVTISSSGNVAFPDMTIPTSDYRLSSIAPWPVA